MFGTILKFISRFRNTKPVTVAEPSAPPTGPSGIQFGPAGNVGRVVKTVTLPKNAKTVTYEVTGVGGGSGPSQGPGMLDVVETIAAIEVVSDIIQSSYDSDSNSYTDSSSDYSGGGGDFGGGGSSDSW